MRATVDQSALSVCNYRAVLWCFFFKKYSFQYALYRHLQPVKCFILLARQNVTSDCTVVFHIARYYLPELEYLHWTGRFQSHVWYA
jgi:hypothetical protein